MHQRILAWLCVGLLTAMVSLRAQTAGVPAITGGGELILVAKVSGTVRMTVAGTTTDLKVDDKVPQAAKINTLNDSRVVLVFSNGAKIQLEHDSEFIIEEYLQDPFATTVKVSDMTEEPSASRTKLSLNRGELVGDVKKLRYEKGSSFTVQTPVGAAGIRGTTFRIVFRPTGTGQAFFQLNTVEGNVGFNQGSTDAGNPNPANAGNNQPGANNNAPNNNNNQPAPGPNANGQADIAVPQGQEITVTVNVTTNAQGQSVVTVSTPLGVQTLSPALAAQITQVSAEIAVATQNAVFTPPPPTNTNSTGTGTNTNTGNTDPNTTNNNTTPGGTSGSTTGSTTGSTQGTTNNGTTSGSNTNNSGTGGNSGSNNTSTGTGTNPTNNTTSTGGTTQITGSNFTGQVTTPPPPTQPLPNLTPGDGRR